jgi:hypothetical protein
MNLSGKGVTFHAGQEESDQEESDQEEEVTLRLS